MRAYKDKLNQAKKKLYATGFFHVFGSNVINQMITFLCGVILVRVLTKTEYGLYSYAYNIVNFFLIFNGLGVTSALLQTCSEASLEEVQKSYYSAANRIGIFFDVIMGIVLVIAALTVPFKLENAGHMLICMSLLPMGMLVFQIKSVYLRATLRTKEFSYSNTINSFVIAVLSVAGAATFRAEGLVAGQTAAYFISAGIITLLYRLPVSFRGKGLSVGRKKDFLKISVISAATVGLSQLMGILDIFILGVTLPDEKIIATYKVATTIPLALIFIPNAIVTYIYPYFSKNKDNGEWLRENFRKLLLIVAGLNAFITVMLIVFSPLIIYLVFGSKYHDALAPFCILSLNYFFVGTFGTMAGNLLVTQRRLKFNFWRSAVMGICNLIGNMILIPRLGAIGAALSTFSVGAVGGLAATCKMWSVIKKIDGQKASNDRNTANIDG